MIWAATACRARAGCPDRLGSSGASSFPDIELAFCSALALGVILMFSL
jgi:hypothetical protein